MFCRKDGSKLMGIVPDAVKLIFILVIAGIILFYIVDFPLQLIFHRGIGVFHRNKIAVLGCIACA